MASKQTIHVVLIGWVSGKVTREWSNFLWTSYVSGPERQTSAIVFRRQKGNGMNERMRRMEGRGVMQGTTNGLYHAQAGERKDRCGEVSEAFRENILGLSKEHASFIHLAVKSRVAKKKRKCSIC